jgi:AcrR family transcriptional regulator
MTRRRSRKVVEGLTKGDLTRQAVVAQALKIAALEGLGAISIGRLAKELRLSKSGLFLHFGSKEKLESAVVEAARVLFFNCVVRPVDEAKLQGVERLWVLCDLWLNFARKGPLFGGYFFSGAFFQTSKQHGPIPRQMRGVVRDWIDTLEAALRQARGRDELRPEMDPQEVAFELQGLLLGAQWSHLMTGRDYTDARRALVRKLRTWASDEIPDRTFRSVKAWKSYLTNRKSGDRRSGHGPSA